MFFDQYRLVQKNSPCLKFPPQFCLAKWPAPAQPIGPDGTCVTQLSSINFARPCIALRRFGVLQRFWQSGRHEILRKGRLSDSSSLSKYGSSLIFYHARLSDARISPTRTHKCAHLVTTATSVRLSRLPFQQPLLTRAM